MLPCTALYMKSLCLGWDHVRTETSVVVHGKEQRNIDMIQQPRQHDELEK